MKKIFQKIEIFSNRKAKVFSKDKTTTTLLSGEGVQLWNTMLYISGSFTVLLWSLTSWALQWYCILLEQAHLFSAKQVVDWQILHMKLIVRSSSSWNTIQFLKLWFLLLPMYCRPFFFFCCYTFYSCFLKNIFTVDICFLKANR